MPRKRRKPATPLCPSCRVNRPYRGGPCPPCLRLGGLDAPEPPAEPRKIDSALTYRQRDEYLEKLGYSSYQGYLHSKLWREIRGRVLAKTSRCWICTRRRVSRQVHHERYTKRNLSGDSLCGLRAVCRPCHFMIEFDTRTGKKRDDRQTRKATAELRARGKPVRKRRARRLTRAMRKAERMGRDTELDRLIARDD